MLRIQFAEPDQAQIGKIGSTIRISLSQSRQLRKVFGGDEGRMHKSAAHKGQHKGNVMEVECCFSQNSIAR